MTQLYGMCALQALEIAIAEGLLTETEQWQYRLWLVNKPGWLPPELNRASEVVFLIQALPPTESLH